MIPTTPLTSPNSRAALIIFFVSFSIGSLYSQILPTLSVYLVLQHHCSPLFMGLFFAALAISTITVSHIVGRVSDRGLSRKRLIALSLLAGAVACIGFGLSPNYLATTVNGIIAFSFAGVAMPQIMALGREYANDSFIPTQVPLFNALLRASFALAWVAGPPIGFYFQHLLGANTHYLYLSLAYIAVAVIALKLLPQKTIISKQTLAITTLKITPNLTLGFIACTLLFSVNQSYLIALPQLFITHLDIPAHKSGYVMAAAAALEIPIMILGGWLGSKMPLLPLMRLGSIAAACLYLGVWSANELWQLIALQIFNAIFIGLIAGLGMTWFQDQLPNYPGTASSLFANSINAGNIIGSLLIALVATGLGYRHLYLVNFAVAVIALVFLLRCKN